MRPFTAATAFGSRVRRASRCGIAVIAAALFTLGCSPATRFQVAVDFGSYIPADQRNFELTVPASGGIEIYVLPGIQIDTLGSGADEDMSAGSLLSVPPPPEESDISLEVVVRVSISNQSDTASIAGANLNLVVANESESDIYATGATVVSGVLEPVAPGDSGVLSVTANIAEGDPGYAALAGGSIRLGLNVSIDPGIAEAPAEVEIQEVRCEVTIRPYSLFRLVR